MIGIIIIDLLLVLFGKVGVFVLVFVLRVIVFHVIISPRSKRFLRFRSKERGTRVKDRAAKTENPVPRSFFAPKPNGNACYAGYVIIYVAMLYINYSRCGDCAF